MSNQVEILSAEECVQFWKRLEEDWQVHQLNPMFNTPEKAKPPFTPENTQKNAQERAQSTISDYEYQDKGYIIKIDWRQSGLRN